MSIAAKLFTDHPTKIGESYFQHMVFAFSISARLFRAAFAAALHGVVPAACETTASTAVIALYDEMTARRRNLAAGDARH